jgi:hypothetical protein
MTKKMLMNLILVLALLLPPGLSVVNAAPLKQEELTYTVKLGDNLWTLAEKYLGSGFSWPAIMIATNQKSCEDLTFAYIANASLIHPGWKLLIPSAEEAEELTEEERLPTPVTATTIEAINQNLDDYVGKLVEVEGYFGAPDFFGMTGYGYLITDYDFLKRNEPMPRYSFLLLDGEVDKDLNGQYITIRGVVCRFVPDYPLYEGEEVGLIHLQGVETAWRRSPGLAQAAPSLAQAIPALASSTGTFAPYTRVAASTPSSTCTYAIIISGGGNNLANHPRYWNDVKFINDYLTRWLGLSNSNVFIVYYRGSDRIGTANLTDYSATRNNIQVAFNQISTHLRTGTACRDAQLLIFTTNHGKPTGLNLLGNEILTHNQLQSMIAGLVTRVLSVGIRFQVKVMMAQCYSGGFVAPLQDTVDAIATAASPTAPSAATNDLQYDEYLVHFVAALNRAYPVGRPGAPRTADRNGDGHILWKEAADFARAHDVHVSTGTGPDDPQWRGYAFQVNESSHRVGGRYEYIYYLYNIGAPGDKEITAFEVILRPGTSASDFVLTEPNTADNTGGTLHTEGGTMTIPSGWYWRIDGNRLIFETNVVDPRHNGNPIKPAQSGEFKFHSNYSPAAGGAEVRVGLNPRVVPSLERHYSEAIRMEGPG